MGTETSQWDEDKFYEELNKVVNQLEAKIDKLAKFARKRTLKEIGLETKTSAFITTFEVIGEHLERCEAQVKGEEDIALATNIKDLVNAKTT